MRRDMVTEKEAEKRALTQERNKRQMIKLPVSVHLEAINFHFKIAHEILCI